MDTTAPTIRARDHEVAELRKANAELVEALGWFIRDPRFVVSVGGNPLVVDRMLESAFATITKHGG